MQTKNLLLNEPLPSSFRDPSGKVFKKNGSLYRKVAPSYQDDYKLLVSSGLYEDLVNNQLLIPHEEVKMNLLKSKIIPFISYSYEWSFSQLKDAALLTLQIQKRALEFGMWLKDSSAYNIQFLKGKPIFIDTFSFEKYEDGQPWVAYRQFCQHFLAPLALMCHKDIRLSQLLRVYIDGIPMDLASSLLPRRTYLNFPLLTHIHLHSRSQKHYANPGRKDLRFKNYKMSKLSLLGLIDSLESAIKSQNYKFIHSLWANYYSDTNYTKQGFENKKQIVRKFLKIIKPKLIWDLGANTGIFSRISAGMGVLTISFDGDSEAVEKNYLQCLKDRETNILPLVLDLSNPSPGIGWENKERMTFAERGPADVVLALALIHHLAISNNLPLNKIAEFFKHVCKFLIIEFVPKTDSNIRKMLAVRKDIFKDYTEENFCLEFNKLFTIKMSAKIKDSRRTLYLMQRK